ncbi:hypothetical protein LV83_00592 [Algoriphagus yeomjeoni]|uniref:Uncharacterized protein n=1 Tax=Algoriphagus yeomjeoni TaxID=291403 RepID=A0A327PVJ6_9BACT|nr:hypothetical protein LV83_00592 [Algoriphagus yeomjeoni]
MKFEQEGIKVFIIHPDDYCSGKRFEYNHVFKLYEIRIQVTRDE